MPKIYSRNCDFCGNFYKSAAKRFCSLECRDKKRIGFKHSEETKKKIGKVHKGKIVSQETREKQSRTRKRIYKTGEAVIWCKGLTAKTDQRLALSSLKRQKTIINEETFRGSGNSGWKGGISKGKYAWDWRRVSKAFKELKGYTCEVCQIKTHGKRLDVHHKDFNKLNNDVKNLIVLCRKCHRLVHPLKK